MAAMPTEVDSTTAMPTRTTVAVVRITTINNNNNGEDHVSIRSVPIRFNRCCERAGGGHYENSYGGGQRHYNENNPRGGGQRGGPNPNYRGQ